MKHIVLIWEKSKKDAGRPIHLIKGRIEITEEDIENLALSKFRESTTEDERYDYSASIDSTII
jgi:hypothetical protein